MFAKVAINPAEPTSFIPNVFPTFDKILPNVFVIHFTIGKAPIKIVPICPQIKKEFSSGIVPLESSSTITRNRGK